MKRPDYGSRKSVEQFLYSSGLAPNKRFGQNFLISEEVRKRIVSSIPGGRHGEIWEIGPGIGALTELLFPITEALVIFELDYGFSGLLEKLFPVSGGVEIIKGDFLKTGIPMLQEGRSPDVLAGNLPYSSGTAMIYRIMEIGNIPEVMVFTLQREVAERLIAAPGSKAYSQLSLVCGFAVRTEKLFDIGSASFYPVPAVTSSVVRMHRRTEYLYEGDRRIFFQAAKDLFRSRRKTVRNNLKSGALTSRFGAEQVFAAAEQAGIDLSDRGENLSAETVARFASLLSG